MERVDLVSPAFTVDGVTKMCDDALLCALATLDGIRSFKDTPASALTWKNTFGAFDSVVAAIQDAVCIPQLMSVGHPDPAVRNAAMLAEPKVDAFQSQIYTDDAVAKVLRTFAESGVEFTAVQRRCVDDVLREYRRNGLSLDAAGRDRLRELNERITAISQEFEKNLAETSLGIDIYPKQLEGMSEAFIANHPSGINGLVRITTDYPDLVPFLRFAKDREAARELYALSDNRAAEQNLPLLKELRILRQEKATLLGFASWGDYVLEPRMAKNTKTVDAFLSTLHAKLVPLRQRETVELLEVQRRILPGAGGRILVSNVKFLEDALRQEKFSLDSQKLAEYFEVSAVLNGVIAIASKLYGIRFDRVDILGWHSDVQVFDVSDERGVIGRVYIDLYPRDGKYKHAAVFGMVETFKQDDESRRMPVAALVCNFPKPGASPALMGHEDVVTFFHEFGHLLHHVLSESELAMFAGTNVARDFVEAPSQMFEAWAWDRESLDLFARHYETGEKIPADMFAAMTAARTFGKGIDTERQLFLATLDQLCHTTDQDAEEIVKTIYPKFSEFERIPFTHFPATFGHLIGYSSAYYGYQWALSIASDLLTRFEKEGMLNQQTAREYRSSILAKGGTVDESTMIESFLGRPSTSDAYAKHLGL